MPEELKPCPHCGGPAEYVGYGYVQCIRVDSCESIQKWPLRLWNEACCWQQVSSLEKKLSIAVDTLEKSRIAINDWIISHAPEFCDEKTVKETRGRITHGILSYAAKIGTDISNALAAIKESK